VPSQALTSPTTLWPRPCCRWLCVLLERLVPPFLLDVILAIRGQVLNAFPPAGRKAVRAA
jgi:hypothetical protein